MFKKQKTGIFENLGHRVAKEHDRRQKVSNRAVDRMAKKKRVGAR